MCMLSLVGFRRSGFVCTFELQAPSCIHSCSYISSKTWLYRVGVRLSIHKDPSRIYCIPFRLSTFVTVIS